MENVFLSRMNRIDAVEKISKARAVILPLGSTEQHGYHLPLETDTVVAEYISKELATLTDCVVLPTLPYGQVWSAKGFGGTISLSDKVFISLVKEIVESLVESGANNVIMLSGHTGNILPSKQVARELLDEKGYSNIYHISYFDVSKHGAGIIESEPWNKGTFHAGEIETSIMLYIDETLVDMSKAVCEYPEIPEDLQFRPIHWEDFVESGSFGDATISTSEKGRQYLSNWITAMKDFILSNVHYKNRDRRK